MSQLPIAVPASRLMIDPKNVRKKRSPAFQAQMKASVAAKGVIQNLVGRPVPRKKGWYYVSAGGSRLDAVNANIADGVFDADYPVPLLVRDGKDASETSLIENIMRADLSPTEECRGYQDVIRIEGVTPAELAKRLHRTERYVKGRLRLADLADPVFDALEAGEISIEVAEAYAYSTGDVERQAAVFELLRRGSGRDNVNEIRRQIASYSYPASDPRCRLVGRDAYIAADGRFDSDLYTDAENERWLDTHIVDRLAEEALLKTAGEIQAREGYAEVRTVSSTIVPYMETYALDTVEGEREPLTSGQQQRLEAIASEIEDIETASEDPGYEPEDDDETRIAELQAEYQAIAGRPAVLGEAQRANARAYLIIGADGQPRLHHEVFALPQPIAESDDASDESDIDDAGNADGAAVSVDAAMDDPTEQPAMSQVQIDRLATMKTELLAVHVASDPAFALDLGTFVMAERATRAFGGGDIPSELRAEPAPARARDFESGTAAAAEWTKFDTALDRSWLDHPAIEDRYDAFCALPDEARAAWLGWCVARTLHAVPVSEAGSGLIDRLGQKLAIDVAAWWRPTARNFFDKLNMRPTLALFEEIGGPELRARYGASKKHDLAASAERLFAGDTIVEADIKARAIAWIPDAMRFGPPPVGCEDAADEDRDHGGSRAPADDAGDRALDEAA
ncbi:ParB/RepB/Spo0J family partition protein [Sphingomonas sp. 2R-10]|uniref:ParB/RepB/Spo0J family partition protein n=1 Tax=Sphingomonas sp. 2R-10 TaxID=3045148 RepID=UPI000F78DE1A|nr:ParB/RepB/Spo0J family partition protein [Sphingomonas sp. 2R-10]MDJ0277699.1 ParB/RepB/Spo0J family partition protein [Sphingomonas sp. 2R-10]